jgi:hypothetical protein
MRHLRLYSAGAARSPRSGTSHSRRGVAAWSHDGRPLAGWAPRRLPMPDGTRLRTLGGGGRRHDERRKTLPGCAGPVIKAARSLYLAAREASIRAGGRAAGRSAIGRDRKTDISPARQSCVKPSDERYGCAVPRRRRVTIRGVAAATGLSQAAAAHDLEVPTISPWRLRRPPHRRSGHTSADHGRVGYAGRGHRRRRPARRGRRRPPEVPHARARLTELVTRASTAAPARAAATAG